MKLVFLVFVFFSLVLLDSCYEGCDDVTKLQQEMKDLTKKVDSVVSFMEFLKKAFISTACNENSEKTFLNDTSIEERVTLLEFQVASLDAEVTNLEIDLDSVEEEVTVISTEQILQDGRILELEIDSDGFENSIDALVSADTEIHFELAVTNSRLTDVNTTLTNAVTEINGKVGQLQVSGTVAFQVDLETYTSIPEASVVVFGVVNLNIGNGYDNTTGQFTVPSGGAGLYYFYVNFFAQDEEDADFLIRVNGATICRAECDLNTGADNGTPSCGAITTLVEGDVVHVFYNYGSDDTPVASNSRVYNTFTGFRIAPE